MMSVQLFPGMLDNIANSTRGGKHVKVCGQGQQTLLTLKEVVGMARDVFSEPARVLMACKYFLSFLIVHSSSDSDTKYSIESNIVLSVWSPYLTSPLCGSATLHSC